MTKSGLTLLGAISALAYAQPAAASLCPAARWLSSACDRETIVECTNSDGSADVCLDAPGGFCGDGPNTFALSLDGGEIFRHTYPGADGEFCSTIAGGIPVLSHLTYGLHHVQEVETNPPSTCSYTVRVVTGPACDADGDGVSNAADNCSEIANADQRDLDEDGLGDACDNDDDGDTCLDKRDQDPREGESAVGTFLVRGCRSDGIVYLDDSNDSDGDGLKNCEDLDDDNDKLLDEDDACPVDPVKLGKNHCNEKYPPLICIEPLPLDCRFAGSGCFESSLLEQLSNPDPTLQLIRPEILEINPVQKLGR